MWSHLARTLAGQAAMKAVPKPSPQARPAPAAVPVSTPPASARSNRQGPWPSGPRAIPFGQIGPLASNAARFHPNAAAPSKALTPAPYTQSTGSAVTGRSTTATPSRVTGGAAGPWSNYQGRIQGESGDYARVPGFTA